MKLIILPFRQHADLCNKIWFKTKSQLKCWLPFAIFAWGSLYWITINNLHSKVWAHKRATWCQQTSQDDTKKTSPTKVSSHCTVQYTLHGGLMTLTRMRSSEVPGGVLSGKLMLYSGLLKMGRLSFSLSKSMKTRANPTWSDMDSLAYSWGEISHIALDNYYT